MNESLVSNAISRALRTGIGNQTDKSTYLPFS